MPTSIPTFPSIGIRNRTRFQRKLDQLVEARIYSESLKLRIFTTIDTSSVVCISGHDGGMAKMENGIGKCIFVILCLLEKLVAGAQDSKLDFKKDKNT